MILSKWGDFCKKKYINKPQSSHLIMCKKTGPLPRHFECLSFPFAWLALLSELFHTAKYTSRFKAEQHHITLSAKRSISEENGGDGDVLNE